MGVAVNLRSSDVDQLMLMPPSVRDWLPEDHLAFFVLDTVAELDLAEFFAAYRADGRGGSVYDPAMMLAVLLYAYCTGARSSRRVERRLVEDVALRVVAANQQPDHATLARFRHRHQDAIAALFGQVLGLCVTGRSGRRRCGRDRWHQDRGERIVLRQSQAGRPDGRDGRVIWIGDAALEAASGSSRKPKPRTRPRTPSTAIGAVGSFPRSGLAVVVAGPGSAPHWMSWSRRRRVTTRPGRLSRRRSDADLGRKLPRPQAQTGCRAPFPPRAGEHDRSAFAGHGPRVEGRDAGPTTPGGRDRRSARARRRGRRRHQRPAPLRADGHRRDREPRRCCTRWKVGTFVADVGYWTAANGIADVGAEVLIATRKTSCRKADIAR